ncbi:MAG: B12-binding domain-containing radical SAM protein [Deltaproteobacteria bacterium]|nr:B12-binding domain-containing radical SAM protein [Deltaproteobacteria bacterium]
MKILLINPTDRQLMFVDPPNYMRHADFTTRLPPLGLLYIASYLTTYTTDHEVAMLDATLENLSYDAIEERIRKYKPDIVGISTYTLTLLDTLEIAHRAKQVNPDVFVVIGGPHAFIYPAQTAMLPYIDAVVPGEGEEVMTELVEALAKGMSLEQIPGIYLNHNGTLLVTPPRSLIENLDTLPFPARKLVPKKAYKFVSDTSAFSTTMISSRGCKFKCTFCDVPFRSIRARSPDNVVDEISECAEIGYKEINFYDDNFNFSEERVGDICQRLISNGSPVNFSIRARVDKINLKMLQQLYHAGCRRINFGLEVGDDETLKYLKKGITTDMVRNAVRLTKDAGIEVVTYFILGIPGRPKETSLRTIDFAIEIDPDYAQFMYMVLLPGTELYTNAIKSGGIANDFYMDFATRPSPLPYIAYWENPLSYEEAQSLTKLAHKRFYLRPTYIWKHLSKVSSLTELLRKGHAALDVFSYALYNK